MHTIHPSLKTLASIAFLATISAATLANTSASTNSSGEKAYIIPYINPYTDPPHALGIPNPSTKPIFKYDFNIIFKDGQCSESQEATILETMTYIAALSDRAQLWEADVLHDWQPELEYWFGEEPETQDAWIKSNAIFLPVVDIFVDITTR